MEYPFPPPSSETIVRHYALLGWFVLLLGIFVWRLYRPVRGWEPLFWFPGIGFLTLEFLHPPLDSDVVPYRPELTFGTYVATLVVALIACIASVTKLEHQGRMRWAAAGTIAGIGTIALLCLVPQLGSAGAAARRSSCVNNLYTLGKTLHEWHLRHGRFPDVDNSVGHDPPLSWRVATLPFVDQQALRERYDETRPWDDPANHDVARDRPDVWHCPSSSDSADAEGRRYTPYVMVTGPQTIAPGGKGLSFPEITDGATNTLLVVEAAGLNVIWTEPRDGDVAAQPLGLNLPGDAPGRSPGLLSSYHANGANLVFADGGARYIGNDIDPQVLKAITTATGGEDVDRGAW